MSCSINSAVECDEFAVLNKGLHDFANPSGPDFEARASEFREWVDASARRGLFQFLRHHAQAPDVESQVSDFGGNSYSGINLASQDYLGLARHPQVVRAAADACMVMGTHSSGSEPMGGGFAAAKKLEADLASFTQHCNVVLFPTGWAAGYGSIKGIVRPHDHVLLDALAHDCLQQGARASTGNVSHFAHNDVQSLRKRLAKIRKEAEHAAVLVVTESLFSMDSDHPDFSSVVAACREFGAGLMVDVAHDLGQLGPGGAGVLAEQKRLQDVDFLVGAFSKTFGCTGGFFASHGKGTSYQVRGYSGSYTFSNYLIPAQVAAISAALGIVKSGEGERLRQEMLMRSAHLRDTLSSKGLDAMGRASALVLIHIGEESLARKAYRACMQRGLILNCIEYPACRRGGARLRMQITPRHTFEQLSAAAEILASAFESCAS
jgi:7-keto-8-aminopelargonate synthetase-like enzyme